MPGEHPDIAAARWIFSVIAVVLVFGCHKTPSDKPDHTAYFDSIFHRVDSLNLSRDAAFSYIDSVYTHFPSPGIIDRSRWYDYKGQYYFYHEHDLAGAMRYVDSSLALMATPEVQQRFPRQYAKMLIDKAETYQLENNYENALFYYRKGLEAIKDLKDSCAMAEYTQRIAMASYRAGRFGDARNLFELALHQFGACHSSFRSFAYQQSNLDNIGECYAAMRKWDSAAYYYDSTLSFIAAVTGPFMNDSSHRAYIETGKAVAYGNLGDYFLYKGDTSRAWNLYQKSIVMNLRPLHDSGNALLVMMKATGLDLARGHLKEAKATLQSVRTTLDRSPDRSTELAWRKLESELLAKSGDLRGAWTSLNALSNLKDSVYAAGTPMSDFDVPGALVHLEDKYTIQLLQERDHIKTAYLLLAVLIVVMLVAIGFLILRGARRSQSHIRQLNRLNKALRNENRQTQTAINTLNEDQAMYMRSLKTIAHDLRNPIGAISSALTLLQQQSGLNDQGKTMVNLMRKAADQSLLLVGGIMQLDLQIGALKMDTIDLEKLLESCVATLQFKAGEKKQTIHLEAVAVSLVADHDKLWRVIINLLDNAIKFSPEGADIDIDLQRQGDKAVISVRDKGIGIPKGMEEKLFTIDATVKRSGTAGEASFGLGLAIVSQIIKAHGGTITVQSEEHAGTTFRIELQAA